MKNSCCDDFKFYFVEWKTVAEEYRNLLLKLNGERIVNEKGYRLWEESKEENYTMEWEKKINH